MSVIITGIPSLYCCSQYSSSRGVTYASSSFCTSSGTSYRAAAAVEYSPSRIRFARNTVDSLTTVRALKDKGVEVYFEKEGIWTFVVKGELHITIMSSLAQEEARSISENAT